MSGESLRDRLGSLSRAELTGLLMLVALLLGGAGLWYVRSLPKPVQVRSAAPLDVPAPGPGSPSPSPSVLLVDVAGWVRRPGVYQFAEGARIVDAIDAAGGARPGAALELLNLAAPLVDGTQVLVVKAGAAASAPVSGAPAPPGAPGAPGGLVNINTAGPTELEALPGIGEVIAQRIVDHRTANGPFASVEELLEVSGIGEAILGSIRELVTV